MDNNELFHRLIDEKLAQNFIFDFDGNNCGEYTDDECPGWDGHSRRCECGNRRVSWVLSDCKTYVYAEAW